jgi:hypothetical protein
MRPTTRPPVLLLEVMDKEPSIAALWVSAIVLGVAGLILARWRRLAGLAVALVLGLAFAGTFLDLRDPFVGPAMLREAGRLYPLHLYASTALGIALIMAGMWHRDRNP